ncbi:unnamed protein product [Caenorhabditis bovis]|uniref:Autophagy-related protein 16 domain-containing protein n=1 Tax=Caenorhabditis bovis TaxID=2654633 RepID=A0A8S1EFX1_9PELO|nr:unnamed protein product [Caenorhabditis bovis]
MEDYRTIILQRLEEQAAKNKQICDFFNSYAKLAEGVNKSKNVIPSTISITTDEGTLKEIAEVKEEINSLYRQKCQNDQTLIEANRKLMTYESELSQVKESIDELTVKHSELCAKYAKLEVYLQKLRHDNTVVNDERLAMMVTSNSLNDKKKELEVERIALMSKIRELNDKRMDMMQEQERIEIEKNDLAMQELIGQAAADTSLDEKVKAALNETPTDFGIIDGLIGDVLPQRQCEIMATPEGEVNDVRWLHGDVFATGGSDRAVTVWRVEPTGTCAKKCTLFGCNAAVTQLDYDRDRRQVLASSNDRNIRLWNADTTRLISTLSGHEDKASCCKFYQTNNVVSGSYDRMIKIWDLQNPRCIRSYFPGSIVLDVVGKIDMNPTMFISGHCDKKIRFWDGRAKEHVKDVTMDARVTSLSVLANGLEMLVSTRDDLLSLLDLRTFRTLHFYRSSNGSVFIWNKDSTRLEKKLFISADRSILSVSWNPTGSGILAASKQQTVAYWK